MDNSIIYILIAFVVLCLALKTYSAFKSPGNGSLCLVNGGVKTGKTTYAVHVAIKEYKTRMRKYKFRKSILKLFNSKRKLEEPILYSNIPLKGVKHVLLVNELLTRDFRFTYGSVILLSEFSLVADSQLIKDNVLNNKLLEFFKLIGHETKGGCVVADTQCISDCHYSLRRCLDRHIYIYKTIKFIPFILLMYVREERYSEDGTAVNTYDESVEESLKKVIIPKSVWKKFDCYCYSAMTDSKPVYMKFNKVGKNDSLKAYDYISFKKANANVINAVDSLKKKYHIQSKP